MKNFNSSEIKELRQTIVTLKQSGMTVREVAESLLPYCVDIDDLSSLTVKVKTQWDTYQRGIAKLLTGENETEETEAPESLKAASKVEGCPKRIQDVEIKSNGERNSDLKIDKSQIKGNINDYSYEDLLRLHNFSPDKWTVDNAKSGSWQVLSEGEPVELTSSKITVKPKVDCYFNEEYQRTFDIVDKMWKEKAASRKAPPRRTSGEKIIILPLADFHLDKREANNASMSFERQKQRFYAIIDWYASRIKKDESIGKAVFFWSQDFFNYDYMTEETTSRRNKQDSCAGYNKMVQEGNSMLMSAITQISQIVPVEIFYTRSNHDQQTAFNTMCGLCLAFKDDKNVIIDGINAEERRRIWERNEEYRRKKIPVTFDTLFDSSSRKYVKWGECLFGFGHGDKEGKRIFNLMQTESNQQFCRNYAKKNGYDYDGNPNMLPDFEEKYAWDKTFVHVFFCGHFHSKQVLSQDDAGVEVIYCGTEMTGDAWHESCGYVGAQRRIECYTYTKDGDYGVEAIQSRNLKLDWEA